MCRGAAVTSRSARGLAGCGADTKDGAGSCEAGESLGCAVVDDTGVAHDAGPFCGVVGPVPQDVYGIGWVEFDQGDPLGTV